MRRTGQRNSQNNLGFVRSGGVFFLSESASRCAAVFAGRSLRLFWVRNTQNSATEVFEKPAPSQDPGAVLEDTSKQAELGIFVPQL